MKQTVSSAFYSFSCQSAKVVIVMFFCFFYLTSHRCLQAPPQALRGAPSLGRALLIFISPWAESKRGFLLWINVTLICPLPHTWRRSGLKDEACSVRGREISHTPQAPSGGPLRRDSLTSCFQMLWTTPPLFSRLILIEDCLPGR